MYYMNNFIYDNVWFMYFLVNYFFKKWVYVIYVNWEIVVIENKKLLENMINKVDL